MKPADTFMQHKTLTPLQEAALKIPSIYILSLLLVGAFKFFLIGLGKKPISWLFPTYALIETENSSPQILLPATDEFSSHIKTSVPGVPLAETGINRAYYLS